MTTTHSSSPTTSPNEGDSLPLYIGVGVGGGVVVLVVVTAIVICVIICLRKRRSKLGREKTVTDSVVYGVTQRKSAMELSGNTATNSSFQHKPVIYDYISPTDGNDINITSSPNEAYDNVTVSSNKAYGMVYH